MDNRYLAISHIWWGQSVKGPQLWDPRRRDIIVMMMKWPEAVQGTVPEHRFCFIWMEMPQ